MRRDQHLCMLVSNGRVSFVVLLYDSNMKAAKDLVLTILCLAVLLACLESALRLLGVHFPTTDTHIDPVIGYALKPNVTGWETKEVMNRYQINNDGMRDSEHTLTRPPNTLRIAFLGDSTTEGVQVALEQTYVSVFRSNLQKCISADNAVHVETLNFAVVGYNLAQNYYVLREKVWKYHPQAVVIALNMATAVIANSRNLDPLLTSPRMYFNLQDGKLVSDTPGGFHPRPVKEKIADLINEFELAKMVRAAKSNLAYRIFYQLSAYTNPKKNVPVAKYSRDEVAYLPPYDADTKAAWDVTESILQAMKEECRAHGVEFYVLTLDTPPQVTPDVQYLRTLTKRLGVPDLNYPDNRIAQWAAAHQVPCFQLAPALRALVDRTHVLLHGGTPGAAGTGHWNEQGHYYAGMELARQFCGFLHRTGAGRQLLSDHALLLQASK